MDVFSKLRSTVTNTVSQLSGVLPGNPVTREFEVTNHICSAGPGLLWKVYQGYKKSTKQEAAIFVLEKKVLERWPRESRETILESLKRGVFQLTKLRHPQILIVQHPLEESRESLAFATEPVFASLANVLGNFDNVPTPSQFQHHKLFDVEIKYGIMQVAEGLAFLHNDVKLIHRNICPESIVINHQGAWKIFGFDFCVHNDPGPDGAPRWPSTEWSQFVPHVAQPNLNYLAPEQGVSNTQSPLSDMFSMGMVAYTVYNPQYTPLYLCNDDWKVFKKKVGELKNVSAHKLSNIPEGLREFEKMMLHMTPELRPDAHQFTKIDFFNDIGVKTLNYLDSLFQWDKVQKSQFYKGLPPVIQNFPHRVCVHRVIPCLAKEFAIPSMVPFVLPSVLQIAETCCQEEYMLHVFPHLQSAMKLTDPVQILLIFMQKMELLLKLTPAEQVKTDVLPMLYRALESDAQQIQELCLSVLPTYSALIDYHAMKNALLPRIKKLCLTTPYMSVRVNCLVCIGKLLDSLDKWLVLDDVLPFLPQIANREPAVLMSILGIYKVTLTHKKLGIPKETIATKIIPFLMPMTVENGLTLNQFNTLCTVLKDMMQRVETEHRNKLEQLNAISQQTSSIMANSTTATSEVVNDGIAATKTDLESIFASMELGQPVSVNVSAMTTRSSASAGLTMDEKQRLVKEHENQQRLSQQASLIKPTPAVTPRTQQPRDLTDTLLQANLSQINSNLGWSPVVATPPQQAPRWQPPLQPSFQTNALGLQPMRSAAPGVQSPMFHQNMMNNFAMLTPTPLQYSQRNDQSKSMKPLSSSDINDLLS